MIFRELKPEDKQWIEVLMNKEWGSTKVVSRGKVHNVLDLPAVIAEFEKEPAGIATYNIQGDVCELVTLNSTLQAKGVGTRLIKQIIQIARSAGCNRLWLITTNDNTNALRFYQKRGFVLKAVYPNSIEESRKLKPEIPMVGNDDIPIRDEIELEMFL